MYAGVAQAEERLICNQQGGGSSPFAGSTGITASADGNAVWPPFCNWKPVVVR